MNSEENGSINKNMIRESKIDQKKSPNFGARTLNVTIDDGPETI